MRALELRRKLPLGNDEVRVLVRVTRGLSRVPRARSLRVGLVCG